MEPTHQITHQLGSMTLNTSANRSSSSLSPTSSNATTDDASKSNIATSTVPCAFPVEAPADIDTISTAAMNNDGTKTTAKTSPSSPRTPKRHRRHQGPPPDMPHVLDRLRRTRPALTRSSNSYSHPDRTSHHIHRSSSGRHDRDRDRVTKKRHHHNKENGVLTVLVGAADTPIPSPRACKKKYAT